MTFLTRVLNTATVGLTLGAVVAAGLFVKRELAANQNPGESTISEWKSFTEGGTWLGSEAADVVVTVFSDIRCVHCRAVWGTLKDLRALYPGQVSLLYRHYPLMTAGFDAARAGVCAHRDGKMEELHDLFVERRQNSELIDSIGVDEYQRESSWMVVAEDVGIPDLEKFRSCWEEDSVTQIIDMDIAAAKRLNIDAVPTILINETRIEGNPGAGRLGDLVERALQETPGVERH